MALRNLFGDVALEATQLEGNLTQEDLLLEVVKQLKIMNLHLAHMSDQMVRDEEVEEGLE
jgi:hypothetical protein